jgi:hypothetical protein
MPDLKSLKEQMSLGDESLRNFKRKKIYNYTPVIKKKKEVSNE